MKEENVNLIIDDGSSMIKACTNKDEEIRIEFPSVVGRTKQDTFARDMDSYVGEYAFKKREYLKLNSPIEKGIITNFDDVEKIWQHTFYNEFKVSPEEHHVLLSGVCWDSKKNRELTTQILFETFNVPFLYLAHQSSLSLYASGATSGISFQSGDQVTSSVAVYSGHTIIDSLTLIEDFSGSQITLNFQRILAERGYAFATYEERNILRDIKEKLCYVADDFDQEMKKSLIELDKKYKLPDGNILSFGNELFRAVEPFFRQELFYLKISLPASILLTHSKNDSGLLNSCFRNIYLSGCTTLFPGMKERIEREVNRFEKSGNDFKVFPSPNKHSVCLGGAIFSSLSTFEKMSIASDEYDEYGPSNVHNKCF